MELSPFECLQLLLQTRTKMPTSPLPQINQQQLLSLTLLPLEQTVFWLLALVLLFYAENLKIFMTSLKIIL